MVGAGVVVDVGKGDDVGRGVGVGLGVRVGDDVGDRVGIDEMFSL